MRFGFSARDEIEMPPFRAQGFEPGLAHDPAQQFAVAPSVPEFGHRRHFRLKSMLKGYME